MREATSPCRTQVPKGKSDSGSGVVKAASLWRSSQEPLLCYKSVKLLFRNSEKCLAWGHCIRAQTTELWAVMAKDVHSQWPTRNLQLLSQLLSVFLYHQEESRSLCSYLWPAPLLPVIHCIALKMPYPTKSSEPSCQMSVGHAPVPADNYGSQGHPFYPPLSSAHNLTCLPSPHDPPPLFCPHGYLDGILWPFLLHPEWWVLVSYKIWVIRTWFSRPWSIRLRSHDDTKHSRHRVLEFLKEIHNRKFTVDRKFQSYTSQNLIWPQKFKQVGIEGHKGS